MKKLYIFSFLIILSATEIFSQSGWSIVHPFPNTTEELYDISFINSQTGYMVTGGDNYHPYSRIYKSTNSGTNWNRHFYDSLVLLKRFYFLNVNTGFAYGSKIYKTTNSGLNWFFINNFNFASIHFINGTGYACGPRDEYAPQIYKTTNEGASWDRVFGDLMGYYIELYNIHFWNELTGIVIGFKTCAKTTNGGINWVRKLPTSNSYKDMKILHDSICYLLCSDEDSLILKSNNFGENWTIENCQFSGYANMNSIDISTSLKGITVGWNSKIITNNQGVNWLEIVSPFTKVGSDNLKLNRVFNADQGVFYALGEGCNFAKTTDYGNNWDVITRGDTLNAVYFHDSNTGFVGGYNGILLKTTNSGLDWLSINSSTLNTITDIYFKDSLNGILIGHNGIIRKSDDGGANWSVFTVNNSQNYYDLCINSDSGFIVGANGSILRTTNFGNSWFDCSINIDVNLNSIYYLNERVYITGDSGLVLKSTDFGINWFSNFVSPSKQLNSIVFTNTATGFISANGGGIYKTSNNGVNWILAPSVTNQNLNNIIFINHTTGYIIGDNLVSLKTTNGGLNWGFQNLNLYRYNNNNKIYSIDSNILYIIGENRFILKTTDGGGIINYPIGIVPVSSEIPDNFSLHQNYPNPFNPVTKIKFDISSQSITKIIIYDLLGREVTTLVDEQLKPGTYEVDWDGTGFASGVYFYSLVTNDFVETKRMVLVK